MCSFLKVAAANWFGNRGHIVERMFPFDKRRRLVPSVSAIHSIAVRGRLPRAVAHRVPVRRLLTKNRHGTSAGALGETKYFSFSSNHRPNQSTTS
jgi:hypothetical protein